ncbi:MAG TPA: thiamine pyrophosphate-dependent enzyme [Verrucomicrobiae bacterium]|nr:thiamine pyrophosphate-dependent enzyme [Verrucomicrobiae bacterium]
MTPEELIAFETEIADTFNAGKIRAPVHLYYGNEKEMIEVFRDVKPADWIFCSWRSHYQCLLKGVPPEEVKAEILAGRSISLCFPKYNVVSSAIVTGVLPIAVGTAMSIKRKGEKAIVHCFAGEMTSETGVFHECLKYSTNHQLPIRFIIEDNAKSVCTDTRETWNQPTLSYENTKHPLIVYYKYQSKYPHAGAGKRVQF